jgi:hypothetical protein
MAIAREKFAAFVFHTCCESISGWLECLTAPNRGGSLNLKKIRKNWRELQTPLGVMFCALFCDVSELAPLGYWF